MFYFVRECSCFSLSSYLDVGRCDPAVHVVRSGPPLRCTPAPGGRGRDRARREGGRRATALFDGFVSKYRLATEYGPVSRRKRYSIATRTQNAKQRGAGPKTVPPPRGSGLKLQLYSYSYSTHCLSAATAFCAASSRSSAERMARPEFLMISLP